MGLASVKSSMAATPWADGLADTLEKTGLLLPLLIVTIAVLAVVYNDRTIFSPPNRKEIYQAPNALPLIGHTYFMFRQGIKDHLEGFMQLCEGMYVGQWRVPICRARKEHARRGNAQVIAAPFADCCLFLSHFAFFFSPFLSFPVLSLLSSSLFLWIVLPPHQTLRTAHGASPFSVVAPSSTSIAQSTSSTCRRRTLKTSPRAVISATS